MALAPKRWVYELLIAVDQLCNVLITPLQSGAYADETMSSRAYRMDRDGKPWGRLLRPVIDALFYPLQGPGHCQGAFEKERAGVQLPPELRR